MASEYGMDFIAFSVAFVAGAASFRVVGLKPEPGYAEISICGMGRIGIAAYEYLSKQSDNKVIGIDSNHERIEKQRGSKINILGGIRLTVNF